MQGERAGTDRGPLIAVASVVAFVVVIVGLVLLSRPHVDKSSPWYQRGYQIGQGVGLVQENSQRSDRFSSVEDGCDEFFDNLISVDDPTFGVPEQQDRPTFVSACKAGAKDPGPLPSGAPTPSDAPTPDA